MGFESRAVPAMANMGELVQEIADEQVQERPGAFWEGWAEIEERGNKDGGINS